MKLQPWPRSAEQAPNADQIAMAIVAAAAETGDSARLAAAAAPGGGGLGALVTRSRWIAVEALLTLYPRCGVANLAEKTGAPRRSAASSLLWAREASWWSEHAVNRVVDAI